MSGVGVAVSGFARMRHRVRVLWGAVLAAGGFIGVLAEDPGVPVVHRFDLAALAAAGPALPREAARVLNDGVAGRPGPGLTLVTRSPGDLLRLEGDLPWGAAAWLSVDVYYDADHAGTLQWRFRVPGESGTRLSVGISLLPRLWTRVAFPLSYLDAQNVFLPRTPPRLKGVVSGRRLPVGELGSASLGLDNTGGEQTLHLANLVLLAEEPPYPVPDTVLVDELGQWRDRDWPGKTAGPEALQRQLEAALIEARQAAFPEEWSPYGGWKGRRFEATGFFRTEHDGRRWWLVDPDGCGFFSIGLDCVRTREACLVLPGMERLFAWLPAAEGPFAPAVGRERGGLGVAFTRANLIRAFGPTWREKWAELSAGRMRAWRFNTIANWSELEALRGVRLPYVMQLGSYPSTRTMLFRDFPDVFAEEFREGARRYARGLEGVREDPWLIGYFMRNEPLWGFGSFNLAAEMLEANPGTATRRALAKWLEARYEGNVGSWAEAWGRELNAFEQVVTETFRRAGDGSKAAHDDLWAFSREMVRAYVRIPVEEVRRVAPHHLNLGMRYAWIASDLLLDAGDSFDVFSINNYRMQPDFAVLDRIAERTGKPVMIGEFHFGALDRGLPATGLRGVASQADRAVAYRRYVETGAAHPALIGVHYFTLNDQPVLGRFDGENYQIGFVDVCHTPYEEIVEGARLTHERLYRVMTGELAPFDQAAREIPAIR